MVEVKLEEINKKVCAGFTPGHDRHIEESGVVRLDMGLTVIQCVNGSHGGALAGFDYVVDLVCTCNGCDKFPAFNKIFTVLRSKS